MLWFWAESVCPIEIVPLALSRRVPSARPPASRVGAQWGVASAGAGPLHMRVCLAVAHDTGTTVDCAYSTGMCYYVVSL